MTGSRRLTTMIGILLIALAALTAACGDAGDGAADPPVPVDTVEGDWVLSSGTVDGKTFPIVDGYRVTMQLGDGQIGGTAACNGYGGDYAVEDGRLLVAELGRTEMACLPEVMASEQAWFDVLTRGPEIANTGGSLVLTGDGVDLVLLPVPAVDTEALVGTEWTLETLTDGEAATAAVNAPRLRLTPDGTVIGSTGCRDLTGTYIINADEVLFTDFGAEGECDDDLTGQDDHIVGVLGDGFVPTIEGDVLTVTSAGGLGLTYRASP